MKKTTVWTALLLALRGVAAAGDVATAHHFVVDGPFKHAITDDVVAAAPAGAWYQELKFDSDTVSLHFQDVVLDAGETILVTGSNPDQAVSFDANSGSDFWTPVLDGGRIEIMIQNRDGGRTSVRAPEVVLAFATMDSVAAERAKVASYHRLQLGEPEAVQTSGSNKIIYGADDRKEPYQVTDPGLLNVANSTCVIVDKSEITNNGNGTYTLHTTPFSSLGSTPLCTSEPFYNQKLIGFCTGFLVGPSILTTAGHCVDADNRATVAFIFDFKMQSNGGQPLTTVSADNIYFASSIRNQILIGNSDHSVINLDRAVVGRNPLPIRRSGTIANGTAITLIGHPVTLPLKIAGGAIVKNNRSGVPYFDANTDSYGGNSGSPVVDSSTYVVEGILVRGQEDFVLSGSCAVSNRVSDNANNGYEQITKSTEWDQYVPTSTATPTITPTPAGSPTVTPTPTISPTPTVSPSPSVSPTISPTPTVSPIPTPSPTPKPEVLFEFASSADNWTNASVSGFVAPTFSQGEGRLVISTTDNLNTFGYWQYGNLRITLDGTGAGTDTAIIGTTGASSLYRATFRLSSNVANAILAPTVRMRASAGNNEQTSELMVSSTTGTFSVSPEESNFVGIFSQPQDQTRIRLAVDVLNVGGTDAVACDVRVQSVLVEAMTKSALTGEVKELDRSLANDSEWTPGNAGDGYLPPVFERTADGLSVKGTSDATPSGVVIGFWSSARGKDVVNLQAGRIYRADFTLASTAPSGLRAEMPTLRLRVNDSSFNSAALTNIESVNASVVLPSSDGGPVVRSVYYVAPAALAGNYLRYSLDYIWSPLLDNDATIPVVLEKLEVFSYDPMQ